MGCADLPSDDLSGPAVPPKTQAPYLCIEPWTGIPARQDVVEDLGCKSDLIPLLPGECYVNRWEITVF